MLPVASSRILILTTNHVGNTLFCTPGIRLLKKHLPNVHFDVVVMSRRAVDVFEHNSDVEKVFVAWSKRAVRRIAARYELVIGLHNGKSREYATDLGEKLIAIGAGSLERHRAESVLQFVQSLVDCPVVDADRRYVLTPGPEHINKIKRVLAPAHPREVFVGFHLGTGRTAVHGWKFWYSKRTKDRRLWPVDQYIELAHMLRESRPHLRFVITGLKNERFLARRFMRTVPGVINLVGRTSLLELAALMTFLRVFVTQDNGALHVAASTDVPLVGLFRVYRPKSTGPYPIRPQHTLITRSRIEEIQPREVCAAVLEHIERNRPRAGDALPITAEAENSEIGPPD